jgi:hypothetical protein
LVVIIPRKGNLQSQKAIPATSKFIDDKYSDNSSKNKIIEIHKSESTLPDVASIPSTTASASIESTKANNSENAAQNKPVLEYEKNNKKDKKTALEIAVNSSSKNNNSTKHIDVNKINLTIKNDIDKSNNSIALDTVANTIQYKDDTLGKDKLANAASKHSDGEVTASPASSEVKPTKTKTPKVFRQHKGFIAQSALSMAKSPLSDTMKNTGYRPTAWIGFGYEMPLQKRLNLQAFMAFTYLNALQWNYTATQYNFGLGANHQTFAIKRQDIFQVHIPICLQYQILPKHKVGIGFDASVNLDVRSSVKDFNTVTYSNRWGYTQPYNPLNIFGSLGYQYQMNSRIAANATYLPGFTDITNNSFNRNTMMDNASRLNLGLILNFGK